MEKDYARESEKVRERHHTDPQVRGRHRSKSTVNNLQQQQGCWENQCPLTKRWIYSTYVPSGGVETGNSTTDMKCAHTLFLF